MTDSMPPLFTLLLRGWLSVFPDPENARWFSVLSGMIAVVMVWLIGRNLTSAYPGLLITAFFAFSPLQLVYSQLIRGYCWFTLLAVMCIGAFLFAALLKQKIYWWGFVITGVLGAYTHYYFAFVPLMWQEHCNTICQVALKPYSNFLSPAYVASKFGQRLRSNNRSRKFAAVRKTTFGSFTHGAFTGTQMACFWLGLSYAELKK